jgi:hypothetical protein
MEKEKGEEIIGYRIGQGLFCVKCYEEGAKTLKAVQNPEDPEVKFPSRPITAEDVSLFICEECKVIRFPSGKIMKISMRKDKKFTETKINMIGEIAKISQSAKLIKRNLKNISENNPLSQKSISTLQKFFSNFIEKIDPIRDMIAHDILDKIWYPYFLEEIGEPSNKALANLATGEEKILRIPENQNNEKQKAVPMSIEVAM